MAIISFDWQKFIEMQNKNAIVCYCLVSTFDYFGDVSNTKLWAI